MLLIREFFDLPSKPVFTPPLFPTFAGTICQDEDCTHADFCEIKTNISLGNRLCFNRIHLISIYREFNFICQRLDSNLSKSDLGSHTNTSPLKCGRSSLGILLFWGDREEWRFCQPGWPLGEEKSPKVNFLPLGHTNPLVQCTHQPGTCKY